MEYSEINRIQPSLNLAFYYLDRRLPEIIHHKGFIRIIANGQTYSIYPKNNGIWQVEVFGGPNISLNSNNELISYIKNLKNITWIYYSSSNIGEIHIIWNSKLTHKTNYPLKENTSPYTTYRPTESTRYRPISLNRRPYESKYQPRPYESKYQPQPYESKYEPQTYESRSYEPRSYESKYEPRSYESNYQPRPYEPRTHRIENLTERARQSGFYPPRNINLPPSSVTSNRIQSPKGG